MLTKLGVMARAAQYVDVSDDSDNAPSSSSSSSKPRADHKSEDGLSSSRSQKKFGHLHVLFRDFSFSGDREEVYQQLMGKEKIVQSLKDKVWIVKISISINQSINQSISIPIFIPFHRYGRVLTTKVPRNAMIFVNYFSKTLRVSMFGSLNNLPMLINYLNILNYQKI